ncbi:MAG: FAD-dependent oxidoreductase, partial [Alphaproteobacteria bacterium]|nr:FAD-dependent oxidoreductase [Alphaproteobacteria bacterium]
MKNRYLSAPQLQAELEKCLQCPTKPCLKACPAQVSPADFIALARKNEWAAAAAEIERKNPLGEVCGLICPDKFCMHACTRRHIDAPIRIPEVQAAIMQKARLAQTVSAPQTASVNGKKVAVIGLGPAGIGAVIALLKHGFSVTAFEKSVTVGGALNYIPEVRLPREVIAYEWQKWQNHPLLTLLFNQSVSDYGDLLAQGFDGVIVATGEQKTRTLGIAGENLAVQWTDYLGAPQKYADTKNVAIIGGGAVAVDCAATAKMQGAQNIEMFVRRRLSDMRITPQERRQLLTDEVNITTMTRPTKIEQNAHRLTIWTTKTRFNDGGKLEDEAQTEVARHGFDLIVLALGSTRAEEMVPSEHIIYAGDVLNGGSTAVEAVASGRKSVQELLILVE